MSKDIRTLVIGDIHGGLRAFIQCLEKCSYDSGLDKLIFLGDYVDGWSESAELIDYLIKLEYEAFIKSIRVAPVFLLGNHDVWCRDWLMNGSLPYIWTQQGGQATIDSYTRTKSLSKNSHKDFFNKLLPYYIDEKNRAFVHGGYTSNNGLGHESRKSNYWWDRSLLQIHAMPCRNKPEPSMIMKAHKEIYIGHTPTLFWNTTNPINSHNLWNIDTGGGLDGKLTIMDIAAKQYWQSNLVKDLYPDEKGR